MNTQQRLHQEGVYTLEEKVLKPDG